MKKVSIFLVVVLLINCIGVNVLAGGFSNFNTEGLVLVQDLGLTLSPIPLEKVKKISNIADEMTALAAACNEVSDLPISDDEKELFKEISSTKYRALKGKLLDLGAQKLTDAQKKSYVLGLNQEQVALYANEGLGVENRIEGNILASVPGVEYPEISGIDFYVYEYTFRPGGTNELYQMAECIALPIEDDPSKMVINYDTVQMFDTTQLSDLANKLVEFSAGEVAGYALSQLVGGVWTFAIGALWSLTGNLLPSTSSTIGASLELKVTSSSRVVHYWQKINGTYYLKLATCAAFIRESWLFVDVNGAHYYKYHELWAYSEYHRNSPETRAVAISIENPESYGILLPYKTQNTLLGVTYWQTKLEVRPFHAAVPLHFLS